MTQVAVNVKYSQQSYVFEKAQPSSISNWHNVIFSLSILKKKKVYNFYFGGSY